MADPDVMADRHPVLRAQAEEIVVGSASSQYIVRDSEVMQRRPQVGWLVALMRTAAAMLTNLPTVAHQIDRPA